jgi:LmbE family N-acetylglucosaminyl deacetylase
VTAEILDRMAIVMAHPDDEILWAGSALRAAEKIVLVYGELKGAPVLTEGRKAAMAAFPLPTLEWLAMVEASVFDSASWPNPRETEYGVYTHPALKVFDSFDSDRYRRQFDELRDRLRVSLRGMKNVIAHGPWGEYGHEDHIQVFRAVASLTEEMGFRLWVPGFEIRSFDEKESAVSGQAHSADDDRPDARSRHRADLQGHADLDLVR